MRIGKRSQPERIARPVYERAVLRSLQDAGGEADVGRVYASVKPLLADEFHRFPRDIECYVDGDEVWKNQVRQAARNLKSRNLIQPLHRAVWCITEAGKDRLRKFSETEIDPDDPHDFDLQEMLK